MYLNWSRSAPNSLISLKIPLKPCAFPNRHPKWLCNVTRGLEDILLIDDMATRQRPQNEDRRPNQPVLIQAQHLVLTRRWMGASHQFARNGSTDSELSTRKPISTLKI